MTDRVAVIGAGQMGNGIAHVFAQRGFDGDDDRRRPTTRSSKGRATIAEESRPADQEGHASGGRARTAILGAHRDEHGARRRRQARRSWSRRRRRIASSSSRSSTTSIGSADAGRDSRHEHQLDLDHRDRGAHEAPGAGHRDALHESGAGDAARRGHSRARDLRRDDAARRGARARRSGRRRSR